MNKAQNEDRYEFHSVKFAHEHMVDIMGALIPGVLFLFCFMIAIVLPLICYLTPNSYLSNFLKDSDWFWIVAFLLFLILSYVSGMIFYREDIKLPDRVDIRREQKKKLLFFMKNMPKGLCDKRDAKRELYSAKLLLKEISPHYCISKFVNF